MSRTRVLIILVGVVVATAIGFRAYQVNSEAPREKVEHYGMGEWVDLSGTFFGHASGENPDGYSLKINSADIISYNEYIEKYGLDKEDTVDGLDERSVVDLEFEIRNEQNADGFIPLVPMALVPDKKNTYYIWNSDLWVKALPSSKDAFFIVTREDSVFVTHIPFTKNAFDEDYTAFKTPMDASSFELVVSKAPTRKVIDIVPSDGA